MWLTHFWHSRSQFFIFAWDVTAGGILRTGVLICLVLSWIWFTQQHIIFITWKLSFFVAFPWTFPAKYFLWYMHALTYWPDDLTLRKTNHFHWWLIIWQSTLSPPEKPITVHTMANSLVQELGTLIQKCLLENKCILHCHFILNVYHHNVKHLYTLP